MVVQKPLVVFKDFHYSIMSINPSQVLVKWNVEKTTKNMKNIFFTVYRGEDESNMQCVSPSPIPFATTYEFLDCTSKLKMSLKNYLYKIRAFEKQCDVITGECWSPAFTWRAAPDLITIYINEEHLFLYEHVIGSPVFIFRQHHEGARCPDCYDTVLKKCTRSNCPTCFGTGFLRPYEKEIPGWMDFSPEVGALMVTEFGPKEPTQSDVQFTNYPELRPGDVVLELAPLRFWKIANVRSTEKNRDKILQIARLDEINKSDIEQKISYDKTTRDKMVDQFNNRQKQGEF